MHGHYAIVTALAVQLLTGAVLGQSDVQTFLGLPDSDKLQALIGALDQREGLLRRMSYNVGESVRTVNQETGKLVYSDDLDRSFAQDGVLQRQETRKLESRPGDRQSAISVWDGKRLKALMQFSGKTQQAGTVKDLPTAELQNMHYHYMLGLRAFHVTDIRSGVAEERIVSLAQWVRDVASDGHSKISVREGTRDGASTVELAVEGEIQTWRYELDPTRGWMPTRYEHEYRTHDPMHFSCEVAEAKEVDGAWVPMVVKAASWDSGKPQRGAWEYRVKDFKTGSNVNANFDFQWPPNTLISDLIANIGYYVKPDGSTEVVPFYDTATGTVFDPKRGTKAVSAQELGLPGEDSQPAPGAPASAPQTTNIGAQPAKQPTAVAVALGPGFPSAGWPMIAVMFLSTLLLTGGVALALRLRNKSS